MHKVGIAMAILLMAVGLILGSCRPQADININPPDKPIRIELKVEVHIYQHAVKDIDEIMGGAPAEQPKSETPTEKKPEKETPPPAEEKGSGAGNVFLQLIGIGTAYAETVPEQQQLRAVLDSMRARFATLKKYKSDKSIGESRSGYVAERPSAKMSDANYARAVRATITAENADRRRLYQLRARMDGVTLEQEAQIYAKAWREKASPGEWIEVPVGGNWVWKQK
jgi:uncharacterized protein YdbL (DUF1318 family)